MSALAFVDFNFDDASALHDSAQKRCCHWRAGSIAVDGADHGCFERSALRAVVGESHADDVRAIPHGQSKGHVDAEKVGYPGVRLGR